MIQVLNGNVALFQMTLGKAMQAIENTIRLKLRMPDLKVNQLNDITGVELEIADLNVLHDYSYLSKQVTLSIDAEKFVPEEEWINHLSMGMEKKGKNFLLEAVQIKGMDNGSYIEMVNKTNEIYKKYKGD